ncbi:glycoside hydrolase family 94 protein [Pseudomonas aeruginosa]|uniref:glycoside hydrolase family 94 protein n=1 Tax=Pseudomonas aeruginosa TaxID=287 RepID=UPI001FC8EEE0|nr:glycoside hydrolase family 94 protein [Pseudomonas aeruginosa]
MADLLGRLCWRRTSPPWNDRAPVREELFGVERLEQHGESLAAAQPVTACPPIVRPLRRRLADNAAALLTAYRASASELERGRRVVPAAEWLLDNYHVVEEQIREIRDDLPPGYYRQLPKLASGPFAGYPRVFGLAWAFVAHTDSHLDLELLRRFIAAYQRVQPLSIGELWAVAITLRIVLVENLRRLVDQIGQGRAERAEADALADALLTPGCAASALATDIARRSPAALSEIFAAQLARRLRDQDPKTNPALNWLDERLQQQGSSVEQAVQHAQQRQGASNVSVRNVITSMRLISAIDWAKLFESVSLVDARLDADGSFGRMDFPTRNLYRSAIEQLARSAPLSELAIAEQALAKAHSTAAPGILGEHWSEPGYHLIGGGRRAFEAHIGFRSPPSLWLGRLGGRLGILGYVGATLLLSGLLLGVTVYVLQVPGLGDGGWQWLALVGALFVPFSEAAVALVNRAVTGGVGAAILPGLELADGIPEELRTLVVVPTLLGGEAELLEQIEQLEVHYLTGTRGDLSFALLADGIDARQSVLERDVRLLKLGAAAIERLNRRHAPAPGGPRFLLLYRQRRFNPQERRWIGWERKRGKLHELNRLLRGATDTSFASLGESGPTVPSGVRFVITLDADTRLPRETLRRLIGKMAHPLNQPLFEAATQRVVSGYAILQPRVTPALPLGREGSLYQRVFSGPGGMDPYAAAVSDVYQDLFGEGSYTGKGIYDVDAFEAAMAGRIGENSVLSHDLFEGIFARAGLASDVEVVEEAPARFDVVAQRLHRWTRGDWQLLPWIIGHWRGEWAVPWVGRSKMLDNLRRSLLAPSAALALLFSWLLPMPQALFGSLLLVGSLALPACLPVCLGLWPRRRGIGLRHHFSAWAAELRRALLQTLLSLAFLADQAWRMGDAIVRTLLRMFVTRRHLLEWTTSAQSVGKPRPGLAISYLQMVGGTSLILGAAALVLYLQPSSLALGVPFMLLWALAPALAVYSSRVPRPSKRKVLAPEEAMGLRLIARQTWRFFETFVGAEDNRLPPDNFQDQPRPVVAHRTSPTNIGLYLLSAVAARDFGWAGTQETLERLEATLAAMQRLSRHRGHFFNWYATLDLHVLEPAYVSSVDSGNLAGHLIALANACEEWLDEPLSPAWRNGLGDTLALVRQGLDGLPRGAGHWRRLRTTVEEIQAQIDGPQSAETGLAGLRRLAEKAVRDAVASAPRGVDAVSDELLFWLDALRNSVVEHQRDRLLSAAPLLEARVRSVAKQARAFVAGMDFAFLFNTERDLFSIGYSLADNSLDSSCYDLLASEARLASLIAIAKGDVPTRHWFRLGRTATPVGTASALISWSGSMFEYLMPSLVMRAPVGSLLEQSNHLVVEVQQAYGRKKGVPWGISESAFNARDLEFTYQYSNFGVPGLGLKRGLAENLVVAPYATGLAAMIKPRAALFNYARLAELGARGRYGFYEALDFTPSRLPDATAVALVHSYMAHHQGMSIVAIANALDEGRMRTRFHREPMIRAVELLLQERIPSDVFLAHPRAEEVRVSSYEAGIEASTLRRVALTPGESPVTHLLSNGRYSVMLSASGAGYSRWRDIAVTRWREDPTRDDWGYYVLLRDVHDGRTWAATTQPSGQVPVSGEILFDEDRAEFSRHDGSLSSVLEVLVSGEDDGEVRRITLVNNGRRSQEIELTSYAELVLAPAAADDAHPAFSKLFVQTEYVAEYAALVATRRLRSGTETPVWAAHFAVVEGSLTAPVEYESDRARFLGRGRTLRDVLADLRQPLSGSAGTVLDPVFSLRRRLRIAPGEMARVSFWIVVAETREALFDLIDKHHERSGFDRARTLAWTQAQVQLRDLDIAAGEAADFQRLAAPLLYADARYRAPPESIRHGSGPQSGLWPLGISGDLPILLLRLDDSDDLEQLRQILRAHQYWRTKGLEVDLAVVNERASSYIQDLQVAIETAVRSSPSRTREGEDAARHGQVHTLRADLMSQEGRALLLAVARVVLLARRGPIASQLAALCSSRPIPTPAATAGTARLVASDEGGADKTSLGEALEFFNGLGGFGSRGQEYVILLEKGESTPAPWINVIANPRFGSRSRRRAVAILGRRTVAKIN